MKLAEEGVAVVRRTNKLTHGDSVAHIVGGRYIGNRWTQDQWFVQLQKSKSGEYHKKKKIEKSEMSLGRSPSKKQDPVTPGGNTLSPQTIIHIPEAPLEQGPKKEKKKKSRFL